MITILYLVNKRLFQSKTDIKFLWIFSSNLETEEEMWQSLDLAHHSSKIIGTLDSAIESIEITSLRIESTIQPVLDKLAKLGEHHLEYGLKKEYYKVKCY